MKTFSSFCTRLGALFLALWSVSALHAQDNPLNDLRIYGYMQVLGYNERTENVITTPMGTITDSRQRNTFSLQQMNLFLSKPLGERFSAFVNLEFSLSYASQRGWGSFSVEEAWVNYNNSEALNIKAGLLLPTFNNLNELKNRTPLLPYLFRPFVYETSVASLLNAEDFLPERSFLQVYGSLPLGGLRLDYAFNTGNSETSYMASSNDIDIGSPGVSFTGEDTSPFKAVGGRIGVRNAAETFKVGVSGTFDRDKRTDTTFATFDVPTPGGMGRREFLAPIGDVPRFRVGADLSFSLGNFQFEGEYIGVFHDAKYPTTFRGTLDKTFYYGSLLYNFTDTFYAYVNYNYLKGDVINPNDPTANGLEAFGGGAGYRITDGLVAKAQYQRVQARNSNAITIDFIYLGLSVIF
ncbi:MAG: outer membrane protein [Candidatus Kapaibacteriota bacterium]